MILPTHLAFALALGLRLAPPSPEAVFFTLFGACLPDADSSYSSLGKRLKLPALVFGHRRFFHSIACTGLLTIIVLLLSQSSTYAMLFAAGYLSHLLLDSLTKGGVMLLWPSRLMARGPWRTGGPADYLLLALSLVAVVAYFL